MEPLPTSTARVAWLLFVGVSLIYITISRGVFLYGDDMLMYQVTEAIVERGSVAVTSPSATTISDPGFTSAAVPGSDGGRYAKYGVGQSLAAIPFYILADVVLHPLLPLDERVDRFGNGFTGARIYGTALLNPIAGGVQRSRSPISWPSPLAISAEPRSCSWGF